MLNLEPGERKYLGDGVYYEFDGYQIWLITNDGLYDTNRIALEPEVFQALINSVAKELYANHMLGRITLDRK